MVLRDGVFRCVNNVVTKNWKSWQSGFVTGFWCSFAN